MPIKIREDVTYLLLKKIHDTGTGMHEVRFNQADLAGRELTPAEFLGHLDYLNQHDYINAEFTGDAYANDVADFINHPEEIKHHIEDGILPQLITFKKAELTDKGERMLQKLDKNPPTFLKSGSSIPIGDKDMPFLEKVMLKSGLNDIYDARDLTELVYRVMRDLMTTAAADRVEEELHKPIEPTNNKLLAMEIADLWHDTNPIVAFLSRVRPPWQGPGIFKIDSDRFLFRVVNEGGMPANVDREQVVKAVFSATKDELSPERIEEIASWLPDKIRQLWEAA
jgi:uncharacterized protein (DUF2267 family)